jgi:hypothetical protein
MKLSSDIHKVNNCGSVRFRFAPAELALAIVMQDEELWAKGLWDLDYTLSMIEEEGFFVPLSAKGCRALGYTWSTSKLLSLNVEILKLADFSLLDYKTRHGKTVAESYEMLFKQYEDITISNHIAEKGIGAASCGYKPHKTHEEFLFQEFGSSADQISKYSVTKDKAKFDEAYELGFVPVFEDYINWSIRFVTEKHPEWLEDIYSPSDILVSEGTAAYFTVQPFEIFNANIMSESDNIWHEKYQERLKVEKERLRVEAEKKKEKKRVDAEKYQERLKVEKEKLRVEAEVEAEACKTTPLNGEYEARWIRDHWRDIGEWEFVGSEPLILDQCEGQFEGIKQFDPFPTPSVRKKLIVKYQTNGDISIKGDLNLYGIDDIRYTGLYGNIHDGEISGIWGVRNRLKIELIKK